MTSFIGVSNLPQLEDSTQPITTGNGTIEDMTNKSRKEKLLSLKEKMQELKKKSDSLEDLWAVYEKTKSEKAKVEIRAKIAEKTENADCLASKIYRSIELEEIKKKLILAKHETDIAIQRSPLSSPSPRSHRSFF